MSFDPSPRYDLAWADSMSHLGKAEWDALAAPHGFPFLEWEWLRLLEDSGCVRPETGWLPHHLTARRGGKLVGAAALYIKTRPGGEYVFDHVWEDLAGRLAVEYYPKLVGASPFTPLPGYRFLIALGEDEDELTRRMFAEIDAFCRRERISGCAFHFTDPAWRERMETLGLTSMEIPGFVWENRGFTAFDDYLRLFNANQRRNIRRERAGLRAKGLHIEPLPGAEAGPEIFSHMYEMYLRTNERFGVWGCRFLNREFFQGLEESFRDRLLFMPAYNGDNGTPVAMSMLAVGRDQLYGRYWGSYEYVPSLHFELCFYSPVQWAVENGLTRFDPGMGGGHKVRRGFVSIANASLYRFTDPRLEMLLRTLAPRINLMEQNEIQTMNQALPFKDTCLASEAH